MELTYTFAFLLLVSVGHINAEDLSKSLTCPDVEDSDDVEFLPSRTNCAEYFMCVFGEPVLMHCPEGLYWDQSQEVCNWPDQISPPCTGNVFKHANSIVTVKNIFYKIYGFLN